MKRRLSLRPGRAFSLVEMLVVVSIIGILAGLLLPAISRAKAKGNRTACLGNVRQLAMIWTMYNGDNNDRIVNNGPSGRAPTWVGGTLEGTVSDATNHAVLCDPQRSLFANYLKTYALYKCPASKLPGAASAGKQAYARSYAMNMYLGWSGEPYKKLPDSEQYKVYRRFTEIMGPSPDRLLVFEEVNPNSICQPFFGTYMESGSKARFYHYPAAYHDRSGVFAYADGHVQTHRWMDKRTYAPASTNYHYHSDPSPGNADLLWLQTQTTIALPKAPPTNNIVTNSP